MQFVLAAWYKIAYMYAAWYKIAYMYSVDGMFNPEFVCNYHYWDEITLLRWVFRCSLHGICCTVGSNHTGMTSEFWKLSVITIMIWFSTQGIYLFLVHVSQDRVLTPIQDRMLIQVGALKFLFGETTECSNKTWRRDHLFEEIMHSHPWT